MTAGDVNVAPDGAAPAVGDSGAPVERSAENWFLDAATFARDGDVEQAIAAAQAGIAALTNTAKPTDA